MNPNDLSIRQLQYVVAVADTRGFHKAAALCNVSQPTLSAQVQQIERTLGVTLFERGRQILLTPAGEDLVTRARNVLLHVGSMLSAAERLRNPLQSTLRIGIIPTIAPYLLPEIVPALGRAFPHLRIVLREEHTARIVADLEGGTLDVAIAALEADLHECAHAVLANDNFLVALPRGHALGRKRRLSLEHLRGETILLLDDAHCLRDQALPLCNEAGMLEADMRATSLSTMAQMVSAGMGITLLPELSLAVENRRAQLDVRPLDAKGASRTLVLAWRKTSPASEAYEKLARVLRQAIARSTRKRGAESPSF